MCNPTLIVAGASSVLQYQVANAQQKAIQDQQKRQNEIALQNRERRMVTKTTQLIEKTKSRLEKIGEAEKVARKKRSIFKVNRENITGNTYDFLLANYYDKEATYRNRVLGNIDRSKFNYLYNTLPALDLNYQREATMVSPVTRGYNMASAGLSFASTYYDYKSKQNRFETNTDPYDYGTSESLYYDGWED